MKFFLILTILFLGLTTFADEAPVATETSEESIEVEKERGIRWVPSISVGSLKLQSENVDSTTDKDLDPQLSAEVQLLWESPLANPQMSIVWGFGFLGLGSKLKADPASELRLSYLNIPLGLRFNLQNTSNNMQFFVRTMLIPSLLANGSVDACRSVFCGVDNDVDDYFRESRSVRSDFNEYQTFASIGLGFEAILFRSFIIDSFGIIGDVSYATSLGKVNRSNSFGKDLRISGLAARLGLAIDF